MQGNSETEKPKGPTRKRTIKEMAAEYDSRNLEPIRLPSYDLYAISENDETFQKIKSRKNWRKIRRGGGANMRTSFGGSEASLFTVSREGRSITTLESVLNDEF